jgi:hypothetical protein
VWFVDQRRDPQVQDEAWCCLLPTSLDRTESSTAASATGGRVTSKGTMPLLFAVIPSPQQCCSPLLLSCL